jgi:acetyl esterase/lipase
MSLDTEVADELAAQGALPSSDGGPARSFELLKTLRALPPRNPYDPKPPQGLSREELSVPGMGGAPEVPVRVYRRERRGPRTPAGIVWFHGGGYVLGSYDMDAPLLDPLVEKTGCVAVSVDYRLAPETRYPGALEDCFAALCFLLEHATDLGVDASRIAIGGLSAGGGLAAAVALLARDRAIPLIHQHLIYPMIDDRQASVSSNWDMLAVWPREMNTFAWRCYLGDLYGRDEIPEHAAPARANNLVDLPSTYIHVGALDGFLHEDIDYAARLLSAGVPTELHVLPGAPHGFDVVAPEASLTKRARSLSEAALTRVLAD